MKILLIDPPISNPINDGNDKMIPLGLLIIGRALKDRGHDVNIYSFKIDPVSSSNALTYSSYDVVCITCLSADFSGAQAVAHAAKKAGCKIILGGILPSIAPRYALEKCPEADVVIAGPGEQVICNIVENVGDESIVINKNATSGDTFRPINPDFNLASYYYNRYSLPIGIITSRGCLFKCSFCTLRLKEPRWISYSHDDINLMLDQANYYSKDKLIRIEDETLNLNPDHFLSVLGILEDHKLNYLVKCRVDKFNIDSCRHMQRANVQILHFGVESASPEMLVKCGKVRNLSDARSFLGHVISVVKELSDKSIIANPVFMLGYPGETRESLIQTSDFILSLRGNNIRPYVTFYTPHPIDGSSINNEIEIITNNLNFYTHKWPVAIPRSLGRDALQLLVSAYNRISEKTNTEQYNPIIDYRDYVKRFEHC